MEKTKGRIVQVLGGVVDVEFPAEQLPAIYEAIEVPRNGDLPLILEVEKHLGNNWVRTVAMDATDGLQRGVPAYSTGAPIRVPVGAATLGRVFNVLGQPIDGKGPVESEISYPIHRPAPPFDEQTTRVEVFETGVKVIDLIAPFTKGGKTGIFGGAGVGKTVIIQELIRSIAIERISSWMMIVLPTPAPPKMPVLPPFVNGAIRSITFTPVSKTSTRVVCSSKGGAGRWIG